MQPWLPLYIPCSPCALCLFTLCLLSARALSALPVHSLLASFCLQISHRALCRCSAVHLEYAVRGVSHTGRGLRSGLVGGLADPCSLLQRLSRPARRLSGGRHTHATWICAADLTHGAIPRPRGTRRGIFPSISHEKPSTSHSYTYTLTIPCACFDDETKGAQSLKIYSHADSLILSHKICSHADSLILSVLSLSVIFS